MARTCTGSVSVYAIRWLVVVLALPLPGLLCWTVALIAHAGQPPTGPVYTVAEIYNHLHHQPVAWVGRTILVRGSYSGACASWDQYAPCVSWEVGLVDPGQATQPPVLQLVVGDAPPALAFIRYVPLLGNLVPQQHMPAWGQVGVYRVRLETVLCGPSPQCLYQGVLIGVQPDSG